MTHVQLSQAKDSCQYGELFYHPASVGALLRAVAELLEGEQRRALLHLSHNLPTTMSWHDSSRDILGQADQHVVCRAIQFRILHDPLFSDHPVRLTAVLCRGPVSMHSADREYNSGLADQQTDGET